MTVSEILAELQKYPKEWRFAFVLGSDDLHALGVAKHSVTLHGPFEIQGERLGEGDGVVHMGEA